MAIKPEELIPLVDLEKGTISPRIFIEEDIWRMELSKLFKRTWQFLAHDSMIPEAGDFFSTYIGADPVIVARQKDGSVRAFLNACRHRGMKVCRAEGGNTKAFTCTYHGWSYNTGGELVNVPQLEKAYHNDLDLKQWGLIQVAQIDTYKGMIFATFDPAAPSLTEYLGDMTYYLDTWLDNQPGGIEVLPGVVKWTIHANWKLAAEQFAGDGYHAAVTHASSLGMLNPGILADIPPGHQVSTKEGHGQSVAIDVAKRFENDPLAQYKKEVSEHRRARFGEERGAVSGGNFTVFPNFSGLSGSANFRVWHPKGPNKFEIWSFTFVAKNAPEWVKEHQQKSSTFTEGAAGIVEIDDGENWDLMGQLLEQGHMVREMNWNYQMGLGHEVEQHETYPGTIHPVSYGDTPQRGFYRRWLQFMTAGPEWPHSSAGTVKSQESEEVAR